MGYIIGIDIGGSTTKIVGLKDGKIVSPDIVRAGDPFTSAYGAFGKYMAVNSLSLSEVDSIICTGVGASLIKEPMFGIPTYMADEFMCVGLGGKFISSCTNAVVVSMGTGTAYVGVKDDRIWHIGGSGIGGGTLIGLCDKLIAVRDFDHIIKMAAKGKTSNVDLTIGDITQAKLSNMNDEITASNFGKSNELASAEDVAAGVLNLIIQNIGILAAFAAKNQGATDIILTGRLSVVDISLPTYRKLEELYGCRFIIPDNSDFATAIGAAIYGKNNGGKQ